MNTSHYFEKKGVMFYSICRVGKIYEFCCLVRLFFGLNLVGLNGVVN